MTMTLTQVASGDAASWSFPRPTSGRFAPLRVGLANLWEFDFTTRFVIDGWLHLRGVNESGKSKTIELSFPAVLDAQLKSQRLDPMRTASRPMRDNLIGPHTPEDAKTAVGYAFVEFGRRGPDGDEFFTCGYGVRAARSTDGHTAWFWAMTDGRVDVDVELFPNQIPLSQAGLEKELEGRGTVFPTQADYRRFVAANLMGMDDDQYDRLMDLLLEIRVPQLGKSLKVADLNDKLTASLPSLDVGLLSDVAKGVNRLEDHRQDLERLADQRERIQRYKTTYQRYLTTIAQQHAFAHDETATARERLAATVDALAVDIPAPAAAKLAVDQRRAAGRSVASLYRRAARARAAGDRNEGLLSADRAHLATKLSTDEARALREIEPARQALEAATIDHGRAEGQEGRVRAEVARLEELAGPQRQEVDDATREVRRRGGLLAAGGPPAGVDVEGLADRLLDDGVSSAVVDDATATFRRRVTERRSDIRAVRKAVQARAAADEENRTAQKELGDARDAETGAADAVREATLAEQEASRTYRQEVAAWLQHVVELPVDDQLVSDVGVRQVEQIDAAVDAAADRHRATLAGEGERIAGEVALVEERRSGLDAELEAVRKAPHHAPPAAAWRRRTDGHDGVPLYLAVEVADGVDPSVAAAVEAALDAAGLLDALVGADGSVVTADSTLVAGPALPGESLASVLVPATSVPDPDQVLRVLRTVALPDSCRTGTAAGTAVAADGTFRAGAVVGHAQPGAAPAFIGEAARRAGRRAEIARIQGELGAVRERLDDLAADRERLDRRAEALRDDVVACPRPRKVTEIRLRVKVLTEALEERKAERREKAKAANAKADELARVSASMYRTAGEHRVPRGRLGGLDELSELVDECADTGAALFDAGRRRAIALQTQRSTAVDLEVERERLAEESARVGEYLVTVNDRKGRVEALEDMLSGVSAEQIRRQLQVLRSRIGAREKAVKLLAASAAKLQERAERAQVELSDARTRLERVDASLTETTAAVVHLARRRLLAPTLAQLGADAPDGDPQAWSADVVTVLCRDLLGASQRTTNSNVRLPADRSTWAEHLEDRRDRETTNVYNGGQELAVALRPAYEPRLETVDGVHQWECVVDGRSLDLHRFADELDEEVDRRKRLLDDEDRKLMARFLTGEVRSMMATQMRRARVIVEQVSSKLESIATNSGLRVKIDWVPRADLPGIREIADLFARSEHTRSQAESDRLQAFLRGKLDDARDPDPDDTSSLADRLVASLDYRSWFEFHVLIFDPNTGPDHEAVKRADGFFRLTDKHHGKGSGGSKSMLLHLPLLAAVAASYESASPSAPRMVALDEAFAGIDGGNTAELLDLCRRLDLDLLMTGYEDFHCVPEVPALAIYDLFRDAEHHVVDFDRWTWDGTARAASPA